MIKEFSAVVSILFIFVVMVSLHYITHSNLSSENYQNKFPSELTKVTNISSVSLSVAYYEPRILTFDTVLHPAYPQMQTMNKMDLVYAK